MSDWAMKPNDVRGFVHKRIGGAIKGFIGSGFNPISAVGGFIASDRPSRRSGGSPTPPRSIGRSLVPRSCKPPNVLNSQGKCRSPLRIGIEGILPGGSTGAAGAGAAVMGQFGAALAPFSETRVVRSCLPGMVLGSDGLCYNRRDIANKEREYPRGTRPLGTPGEMAALRKAAAFGRRMETTVKRMQKIGVLKKKSPPRRMITSAAQHHAGG